MKTSFQMVVQLTLAFLLLSCASATETLSDRNQTLTTAVTNLDKVIVPVTKFSELLDTAIKDIQRDNELDNFILFVHGRGKHPEKAYKKSLISDLESNYSAKVIMFHWPSWEGLLAFPEANARKSAEDFWLVLEQLKKYQQDNPEITSSTKFTLLTHSMGSIVLEESMLNHSEQFEGIFSTVVISSSASSGNDHATWVSKIDMSDNIYITINRDDPMLGKAGVRKNGRRLGKGLANRSGDLFSLAQNAIYVDLTASGLGHRYYIHRDQKNRPVAMAFFNETLNGKPASFNNRSGIEKVDRERVYILKRDL